MKLHRTLFTAWVFAAGVALHAQNAHNMVVQTNKLGAEIQPTMYGLFFEDINYGADGGLYAELVKNRSFEFPQRFMGWNVFGNVTLMDDGPFERNPHYVRLGNSGHREKHTGIENEGFFGGATKTISEATQQKVDAEIRNILDKQYALARTLLESNRDKVEMMTKALLEWETIDAEQINDIMAGLEPRPPKVIPPRRNAGDSGSGGISPNATAPA